MKEELPKSLGSLLKRGHRINDKDIVEIRTRLRNMIKLPSYAGKQALRGKTRTAFSMSITKFDFQLIDLYHGEIKGLPKEHDHPPMVFSFHGPNGRLHVPAIFNPRKSIISCLIPTGAISGDLELFVPVKETLGTEKELERLSEAFDIGPSPSLPGSFDTDICPPFPWPPFPREWYWRIMERIHFIQIQHSFL